MRSCSPERHTGKHQKVRDRRHRKGRDNRRECLGMEETQSILDKRPRLRQARRPQDKVRLIHQRDREPPAFETKANLRRRRLKGIHSEIRW